jgi:hypothetical protein
MTSLVKDRTIRIVAQGPLDDQGCLTQTDVEFMIDLGLPRSELLAWACGQGLCVRLVHGPASGRRGDDILVDPARATRLAAAAWRQCHQERLISGVLGAALPCSQSLHESDVSC